MFKHIRTIKPRNTDIVSDWKNDLTDNLYLDSGAMILTNEQHKEIINAQLKVVNILKKVSIVLEKEPTFNEWLGLSDNVVAIIKKEINHLTTYGRFDWMISKDGELKVIEFNAETPMGWIEAVKHTSLIHKHHDIYSNPNIFIPSLLEHSIKNTINSMNINGIVAIVGDLSDDEENDTFNMLKEITEKVCEDVMICNITDLKAYKNIDGVPDGIYIDKDENLYPIDILQTFYSLEWLLEDDGANELLEFIKNGKVKFMNPASTLQLHSKGIWALIWFLYSNSEIFTDEEYETINKYIPYSSFEYDEMLENGHEEIVKKPLNHREGDGIEFITNSNFNKDEEYYYLFQEKIDSIEIDYYRMKNENREYVKVIPTIGTYYINDCFAGYMTRLTETICSAYDSTFISTFVST